PAAGLITLGAMRRVLEIDGADDQRAHFQRIENLVRVKTQESTLRHRKLKGRFVFDAIDANGMVWVRKDRSETADRITITPKDAIDWRFEGEAPIVALSGKPVPYETFYAALIPNAPKPLAANLQVSDSRICLAGRVAGESESRRTLAATRFA